MAMKSNNELLYCTPGQCICVVGENTIAGQGTYEQQGYIFATLLGYVQVRKEDTSQFIEVKCVQNSTLVPIEGDIITARINQVNQRFAKCKITCIGNTILDKTYRGVLRREDVKATNKDSIKMYDSVRPGDVILARVMPQTDMSCCQLSTAENELGVVFAIANDEGEYGVPMVPVSWSEMQCPNTLVKEFRKVARVLPESALQTKYDITKEEDK